MLTTPVPWLFSLGELLLKEPYMQAIHGLLGKDTVLKVSGSPPYLAEENLQNQSKQVLSSSSSVTKFFHL